MDDGTSRGRGGGDKDKINGSRPQSLRDSILSLFFMFLRYRVE